MTEEKMPSTELAVKSEPTAVTVRNEPTSILQLLNLAVDKSMSVEGLEKLVNLYERIADRQAAQEFADALARFQAECPPIPKTSKAEIVSNKGGRFTYFYASLGEVVNTVRPLLHQHGLSYGWDETESEGRLTVTCTLRHRNGHKETANFSCPVESSNPGMAPQHKTAAAYSFARRHSLIGVLGLATADPDTDGQDPSIPVSEEQVARLEELFDGLKVSKPRFYRFLGMPEDSKLSQIPAVLYEAAANFLTAKRTAQQKGAT